MRWRSPGGLNRSRNSDGVAAIVRANAGSIRRSEKGASVGAAIRGAIFRPALYIVGPANIRGGPTTSRIWQSGKPSMKILRGDGMERTLPRSGDGPKANLQPFSATRIPLSQTVATARGPGGGQVHVRAGATPGRPRSRSAR